MSEQKISVCVPTLVRYDLLGKLINSLRESILKPDNIYIIDNGGDYFPQEYGDWHEWDDPVEPSIKMHYWRPVENNIGVARSWNWFASMVPDVRVVVNDDVSFTPSALGNLVAAFRDDAIISPDSIIGSNSFSCFMLPDALINILGLFDESISPNYAFFEDNDWYYRLKLAGFDLLPAPDCLVHHNVSSTLQAMSLQQQLLHHERFRLAEANFIRKWGGLPHHETYLTPYNEGQKVGQS